MMRGPLVLAFFLLDVVAAADPAEHNSAAAAAAVAAVKLDVDKLNGNVELVIDSVDKVIARLSRFEKAVAERLPRLEKTVEAQAGEIMALQQQVQQLLARLDNLPASEGFGGRARDPARGREDSADAGSAAAKAAMVVDQVDRR